MLSDPAFDPYDEMYDKDRRGAKDPKHAGACELDTYAADCPCQRPHSIELATATLGVIE